MLIRVFIFIILVRSLLFDSTSRSKLEQYKQFKSKYVFVIEFKISIEISAQSFIPLK